MSTLTIDQFRRAAVAGLAAADAITWNSWWHRLGSMPPRRYVRLDEAWQHDRALLSSSLPTPYLQSTAPAQVGPTSPTDDTEWLVVALRHHLGQRLDGSPAPDDSHVWDELARLRETDLDAVRPRIGTVIALENMAEGYGPPLSGQHNPHYFDDIACVRGIAAGLLRPGDPGGAADLAEVDARFTHSSDGVYGARATAALFAVLASGEGTGAAVDAAREQLPEGSWSAHVVEECLAAVREGDSAMSLAARLEGDVVDHVYAYANQVPETLGLLLAHLSAAETADSLMLGALAHPRHADGLVPLAGAVSGAVFGEPSLDDELPVLRGVSVRALAGTALDDVLADLAGADARAGGSR